jgi:tripartite-type tricarboxylate transporter receptor subunit TctC
MNISMTSAAVLAASLIAAAAQIGTAQAQDKYPERPVTIIVPFAAGGVSDQVVRAYARAAEPFLGQPILVDNKPSAGNTVGFTEMARAKPDGYTLGHMGNNVVLFPLITGTQVPYSYDKSYSYITNAGDGVVGIAVKYDAPWKTLGDLIEDGKKNPGKLKYGTTSVGSTQHLMVQAFAKQTGASFVHIPQVGSAAGYAALLGGNLDFMSDTNAWAPFVAQKQLRVLAVSPPERISTYPDIPTLKGLGYRSARPFGVFVGPAGLPEPIRAKLENALRKARNDPALKKTLEEYVTPWEDLSGAQARDLVFDQAKLLTEIFSDLKK